MLKSGSKPIKPRDKRKKVDLLGTLDQFKESKKKPVPPQQQPRAPPPQKPPGQSQPLITDVVMMAPQPNLDPLGKDDNKKKK